MFYKFSDMFRIVIVVIAVFIALLEQTLAIKCYLCTVGPTNVPNRTRQLCQDFSETNEFVVDCPFSTMCMKKVFKYELLDGRVIETFSRNCANQKYTEQVFKEGRWQKEISIEEPYEPGCTLKDVDGGTTTIYCHCRGSYCNSATKEAPSYHTDAMAVIFVFNAMKYLRSVD